VYIGFDSLSTNEPYLSGRLLWIGVSLGVIFAILYYFPFPLSIPLAVAAFLLLNFYLRRKIIKRMNMIFGNPTSGDLSSSTSSLSYSCLNCRTRHNEIACPRCGSKMKRADFYSF
jgi:uncharacterized paraquat-inducible protein A